MTIFWIYVVTQCVTTAYGITVINSVKKVPALKKRLKNAGYTKQDKESLYKFNDFLKHFFLGLIPFYFAIKAVQLINDDDPVGVLMRDEIKNGNYISDADRALFNEEEQRAKESIAFDPNAELYDSVETYKARKIDLNNIYNDDETPLEYIEKEISNENIKLTPFTSETSGYTENEQPKEIENNYEDIDYSNGDLVSIDELVDDDNSYKTDAVYEFDNNIKIEEPKEVIIEPKEEIIEPINEKEELKETILTKEVTNSDIAKAISNLSEEELKELSNKLISLAEIKRNKELLLEKDVA